MIDIKTLHAVQCQQKHGKIKKQFELMLTRRAKTYSISGSVV